MKGKNIGITASLVFCSIMAGAKEGPIHKSDIDLLKQQRQFNKEHFHYAIKDLQDCVRMSKNLSSQLANSTHEYQKKVEEVQNKCHSRSITNKKEFDDCLSAQYSLRAQIESLIYILPSLKGPCSRTQYPELTPNLKALSRELEERIAITRTKYLAFFRNQKDLETTEKRRKKYPNSIKAGCYISLLSYLERMQWWSITALINADVGDIYDVERALKAIKILKDDMATRTDLCKIHERMKDAIAKSEEILKKTQNYKKPFEEMAQKICGHLDQKKPVHRELCQEPLNNDSWKYSASQALEKQRKENKEKRLKEQSQSENKDH